MENVSVNTVTTTESWICAKRSWRSCASRLTAFVSWMTCVLTMAVTYPELWKSCLCDPDEDSLTLYNPPASRNRQGFRGWTSPEVLLKDREQKGRFPCRGGPIR